jgi:hypothetical protein
MDNLKPILTEIVNRLSDLGASLDALEAELEAKGSMTTGAIGKRFAAHQSSAEAALSHVRAMISQLQD